MHVQIWCDETHSVSLICTNENKFIFKKMDRDFFQTKYVNWGIC